MGRASPAASEARQAAFSFDWLEILPWGGHAVWEAEHPPVTLRRLPYLDGLQEAASLAILPVPDEQGVPGFPRARKADSRRAEVGIEQDDAGVRVGSVLDEGSVSRSAT